MEASSRHIYLLGPMGSGKSRLGKELAPKIGFPFLDLDRFIEQTHNTSIQNIFDTQGEDAFRAIERACLIEIAALPPAVIALGGGTPCFFDNMEVVKATGYSIYLRTPVALLAQRLSNAKTERPLLAGKDETAIREFLTQQLSYRERYYGQADTVVENNGKLKAADLVRLLINPTTEHTEKGTE